VDNREKAISEIVLQRTREKGMTRDHGSTLSSSCHSFLSCPLKNYLGYGFFSVIHFLGMGMDMEKNRIKSDKKIWLTAV
jgi:hypothetical protein